jgi:hypothetical protein
MYYEPNTEVPPMLAKSGAKRVHTVRLDPYQIEAIERLASKYGVKKSEVLREAVDQGIVQLLGGRFEDEVLSERVAEPESGYLYGEKVLASLQRHGHL